MKRLFITHTDLDGHAPIVLLEFFGKTEYYFDDIMICDYGFEKDQNIINYTNQFEEIIISDLSLSEEVFLIWKQKNISVKIFDHHSETDWISKYEGCVWDDTRSGTKIFWEEYLKPQVKRYPPIIDHFVNLIDTYDLWKQEDPLWDQAKDLNNTLYGIKNYNKKNQLEQTIPFYEFMVKKLSSFKEWKYTRKEKEILEKAKKRESEMYKKAMDQLSVRKDSKNNIFGVFILPSKISIVASEILKKLDYFDYVVVINSWGGINGKLSFRSRNGFNCNDLCMAKGHDAAAGGLISVEQAKEFFENQDLSFKYNTEWNGNEKDIFNEIIFED